MNMFIRIFSRIHHPVECLLGETGFFVRCNREYRHQQSVEVTSLFHYDEMDHSVFALQKQPGIMKSPSKDDILTALALIILLFSAMVTWTISSWIILIAIIIIAIAWYFRK